MAAIDPTEEPFGDNAVPPRVTLKIIRNVYDAFDSDEEYSDDDEFDEDDVEAIKRRLGITDEDLEIDDLEDDDEELVNGGPSDPEKLKKAKLESVLRTLDDEDDDVDMDITNGINGSVNKGKARLIDDDSEVSDDNEVTEFVVCTLDPNQVCNDSICVILLPNAPLHPTSSISPTTSPANAHHSTTNKRSTLPLVRVKRCTSEPLEPTLSI
jgi:FK506-binding nuclear protein